MSSSEIMKDVCDGHYIKSHELKDGSEIFLQFVMSYDDLELQNLAKIKQNSQVRNVLLHFIEHSSSI